MSDFEKKFYNDTVSWLSNLEIKECPTHKQQYVLSNNYKKIIDDFINKLHEEIIIFKHINYSDLLPNGMLCNTLVEFILITEHTSMLVVKLDKCCDHDITRAYNHYFYHNIADVPEIFDYCMDTKINESRKHLNFDKLWNILDGMKSGPTGRKAIINLLKANTATINRVKKICDTLIAEREKFEAERGKFEADKKDAIQVINHEQNALNMFLAELSKFEAEREKFEADKKEFIKPLKFKNTELKMVLIDANAKIANLEAENRALKAKLNLSSAPDTDSDEYFD